MMETPLLQIRDLQVDFTNETGTTTAVHCISFDVYHGEIFAIVGESGSGKSVTALSILQLLPQPSASYPSGSIIFNSSDGQKDLLKISYGQMRLLRGNEIAMIFQEPMTSLNPVFTCGEQVIEAIRYHQRLSYGDARKKTLQLFEKVRLPEPAELLKRYPHQLSGGQKQRVMIAVAMSCNPALLICDEPTTALDVTVQKTILDLIRDLQNDTKMSVIFITHDLGVVAEIADRVAVMYKGKIVEEGYVRDVFHTPFHPYTKGLLACRPLLYSKGMKLPVVADFMNEKTGNAANTVNEIPEIEKQQTDATVAKSQSVLIKVEQLSVWFPARKSFFGKPLSYSKAVDNVSFEIIEGETLGIVGESGSGKTTLGRALLKLIEPTTGKIFYKGTDLTLLQKKALTHFRRNIQIVFQDPYSSLNPRITIGSAIEEPLKVHGIIENRSQRREMVYNLLKKVNLQPDHYHRYPHEFSGGQRQRIVIARALALSPSFLVCDESVSALDVSIQAQVLNLLNDLKKEYGFTIVFISHDLSVVRYISDRIMVMNRGKIVEMGDAEDIYNMPQSDYTRRLVSSIPAMKKQE